MPSLSDIQQLINSTAPNGVCELPGGVVDCPDFTPLLITKSITLRGNGTVFNLPQTGIPGDSFIKADSLPNGSYLEISNLTVNGPSTLGWEPTFDLSAKSMISYQLYKTWDSRMVVKNVVTRGGYSYGLSRAGGGKLQVIDCDLQGWVGAMAFFESHGGWGDLIVRDTKFTAPAHSKHSSIGIYIHPHLSLTAERLYASDWNRYAIYLNGSPQSQGNHDLIDVTAHNCSLIHTGSGIITTLFRCTETGKPANGGSYMKGDLVAVDCNWMGEGCIGLLPTSPSRLRFYGNRFATKGYWFAASSGGGGTVEAIDCEFILSPTSRSAVKTTSLSTTAVEYTDCIFTGTPSWPYVAVIEGGSIRLTRTTPPPNSVRVTNSGVLLS